MINSNSDVIKLWQLTKYFYNIMDHLLISPDSNHYDLNLNVTKKYVSNREFLNYLNN